MRKMNMTRVISVFLLATMLACMTAGCAESGNKNKNKNEEVKIPMVLTVNPSTGKKNEEKVVRQFNKDYDGQWEVEVSWIVETEEEYRQNLKRLNVTDTLPAVITDLRLLPSFYHLMIQDGRIENLSDDIQNDQEWKEMIEPVVLESCTEPDGSVYLAPLSTAAFACSGIFWNEELFAQAGINSFPTTWEEFWECCEQLSAHGITPLALHTEGTAWATMLMTTAALADTSGGSEFMKQLYPDSYQNESGLYMAETIKKMFHYTTDNALYADFDVAYENFFSGNAAMIPNGYWMLEQIPEDCEEKVRFSAFPGNRLICSPETFGWAVVSDYSDEVKQGAMEFLKFRTKLNKEEKESLMATDEAEMVKAKKDYISAYQANPQLIPNYQVKWNSILQETTLGEAIPQLVTGKITSEEFTEMEDESVSQLNEEY